MAGIRGYDSSSIGILFSSINNKRTTGSMSGLFSGGSSSFYSSLSDYASIKSGSYHKLLNAYYGKNTAVKNTDSTKSEKSDTLSKLLKSSTAVSRDNAKTLAFVENSAEGMKKAADTLLSTEKGNVFSTTVSKDENGVETKTYDINKIYSAVSDFVDHYNDTLDHVKESNTTSIRGAANTMKNYTKVNERALKEIGISIGSDKKLTLDETVFKNADMSKVENLFHKKGSYGAQISAQAGLIDGYAENESAKANTYTYQGSYSYNYNSGSIFNSGI